MSALALALAVEADRAHLATFTCGVGAPYLAEVNQYVRTRALDDFLDGTRADKDFRLLLLWDSDDLVGVTAYERNWRVVIEDDGAPLPGTEIVVFALAAAHQGRRLPSKQSMFRAMLDLVVDDITESHQGEWLTMVVSRTNAKMVSICRDLPNVLERRMRSSYISFITRL